MNIIILVLVSSSDINNNGSMNVLYLTECPFLFFCDLFQLVKSVSSVCQSTCEFTTTSKYVRINFLFITPNYNYGNKCYMALDVLITITLFTV